MVGGHEVLGRGGEGLFDGAVARVARDSAISARPTSIAGDRARRCACASISRTTPERFSRSSSSKAMSTSIHPFSGWTSHGSVHAAISWTWTRSVNQTLTTSRSQGGSSAASGTTVVDTSRMARRTLCTGASTGHLSALCAPAARMNPDAAFVRKRWREPMIRFLTLFIGLVTGPQAVEFTVAPPVVRAEVRLEGSTVATIDGPPWTTTVDLGSTLRTSTLEVVGFDAEGAEVSRDRQFLNAPRPRAEAVLAPRTNAEGTVVGARLTWSSPEFTEPRRVELTLDGRRWPYDGEIIDLTTADPESLHLLEARLVFSDEIEVREQLVFGKGHAGSSSYELTAVPVLVAGADADLDPAAMEDGWSGLTVPWMGWTSRPVPRAWWWSGIPAPTPTWPDCGSSPRPGNWVTAPRGPGGSGDRDRSPASGRRCAAVPILRGVHCGRTGVPARSGDRPFRRAGFRPAPGGGCGGGGGHAGCRRSRAAGRAAAHR
jgi:hypothetical protein